MGLSRPQRTELGELDQPPESNHTEEDANLLMRILQYIYIYTYTYVYVYVYVYMYMYMYTHTHTHTHTISIVRPPALVVEGLEGNRNNLFVYYEKTKRELKRTSIHLSVCVFARDKENIER